MSKLKNMRLSSAQLCLPVLLAVATPTFAQSTKTVTGRVLDDNGEAVIGAVVTLDSDANVKALTDLDGNFTIKTPATGGLTITYIGYKDGKATIDGRNNIEIIMSPDSKNLNEVVVVGYGTQKRANITGSVAAIDAEELTLTKNQNVQNMLTGKVAGVRVIQKTSEPGDFSNQFDIRGFGAPLVVIDGVPRDNMARIDPNEIESISVLKDASASIYGVRGANGVVLITTKKGQAGKAKIDYNMYYGIQTPAEQLRPVGSAKRMMLFNEKSMRNTVSPALTYSQEEIDAYLNGTKQDTDWYDAILRGSAPQQNHNVSISGASNDSKIDYFVNYSYTDQEGFLRKNAMSYDRHNIRSNINAQITNNLKASVKLAGILDTKTRPQMTTTNIFNYLWRSLPDDPIYADAEGNRYQHPTGNLQNMVAAIDHETSGYYKTKNRIFQGSGELTYSVPWVKGLSLKAMFSYDNNTNDITNYNKAYNDYLYNETSNTYTSYPREAPSKLTRTYTNNYNTLWQGSINYDNTFGKHHVNAILLIEEAHKKGDNFYAAREMSLAYPYLFVGNAENQEGNANAGGIYEKNTRSFVGRLNYDYESKYIAEMAFRYDGSSIFSPKKHWGFFPSVSLGWRMSEEKWMKDNESLKWIDNVKIRASWGKAGNDGALEYQYVTGYNYPNTSGGAYNTYPKGYVFNGNFTNSLGFRSLANEDITWYNYETYNLGIDVDLWNGLFGFTVDLFKRDGNGLLATLASDLPGSFGSSMPQSNINSDRTKGFELELRHHNRVGDFIYDVKGNMSLTRSMWRYHQQDNYGNEYQYWLKSLDHRYNDVWFGYGANGRYENWDDIRYTDVAHGNEVLPGDYIYEDWNHDGVIDDTDKHPIATATNPDQNYYNKKNYPLMTFGVTMSGQWKGFDLSMAWQGSSMSYISYGEQLASPLSWDGNAPDRFMDRWHPIDATVDPYNPNIQWASGYYAYGGKTPDIDSDFGIQDGTYVRLKSAEIGYTLPKNLISTLGIQNLRFYISAYNLLTITNVKGMDPEHPNDNNGYMYPLNRSYNFGVNLTF